MRHKFRCWGYKDEKQWSSQQFYSPVKEREIYKEKYLSMHRILQMFTEEVHLMQNEKIGECPQKGWLLSCVWEKKLELARGRRLAIPGGGNSGHCCHSSSCPLLQPHHALICYITLVKHGTCHKNYFIKKRILNLLLDNAKNEL